MEKRLKSLSKMTSHALRHEPWLYELELDDEGWVRLTDLIEAFQLGRDKFTDLSPADFQAILAQSDKQRFELRGDKIRALYGHSTPQRIAKNPTEPPTVLYHGTAPETAEIVLKDGLKPMSRQYVHLSADVETARMVGQRKAGKPVLLTIASAQAHRDGVVFYHANETIWLADHIPASYLSL